MLPLPCNFVNCPGLFYGTSAGDGALYRIRIPGGILSRKQFCIIADLADEFGNSNIYITNRANLQLRKISTEFPSHVFFKLKEIGLASAIPEVDHLRNIMGSPTAGIDPYELIDTRPLISKLNNYISTHRELAPLSPKFSIAVDGGGAVSICDRSNDIIFNAVSVDTKIYFRLKLNTGESHFERFFDVGVLLEPEECLEVAIAFMKVYLQYVGIAIEKTVSNRKSRKPRLFEILNNLSVEKFLQEVECRLSFPVRRISSLQNLPSDKINPSLYQHIDVHPQRQHGLSYVGVAVPLGKLETWQMRSLADIAQKYGSDTLRLTPWQNLLISDIPQEYIHEVKSQIESIRLHWDATNIYSALVACVGNTGCASSETDTKGHALSLAQYLDGRIVLEQPVNIHFTGCQKSCAQHTKSDIALLGNTEENKRNIEGYRVFLGDCDDSKFGRELYNWISFAELPLLIERILRIYIAKRTAPNESFRAFVNGYAIADLQALISDQ
jgi:ferredoxin-nitrite reductase